MDRYIRLSKLAEFLKLEKHVLRKWLECWEPFASRETQERSAIEFTPVELLFLAVGRVLVIEMGMNRDSVSAFSEELFVAVRQHWSKESVEVLLLQKKLGQTWKIGGREMPSSIKVQLPITELRNQVFRALGIGSNWQQGELRAGLVAAR